MAKKPVKYFVADAFTGLAFKGNPAAICLLEEERSEEKWLQALAAEFNIPITCYLIPINEEQDSLNPPKFSLRWFTPLVEVELCGHGTLAAAHILFSYGLVNSNIVEFSTLCGILTAKTVPEVNAQDSYFIELDLPAIPLVDVNSSDISSIFKALNNVASSIVDIVMYKVYFDIFLVVLPSEKDVLDFQPNFDEIRKCPGNGVIITGAPHAESKFDFYSRIFCPKLGLDEDYVCGSAHCALAVYWAKKLGKSDFVAYMASSRSGILNIHLDEQKQRVLLRGKAITTMEGVVLV